MLSGPDTLEGSWSVLYFKAWCELTHPKREIEIKEEIKEKIKNWESFMVLKKMMDNSFFGTISKGYATHKSIYKKRIIGCPN